MPPRWEHTILGLKLWLHRKMRARRRERMWQRLLSTDITTGTTSNNTGAISVDDSPAIDVNRPAQTVSYADADRHPDISVIICTKNREALLAKALQGLCAQTLDTERFEVIVVDDGSVDDTKGTAASFKNRLPLIYTYQQAQGLAAGKNAGIEIATGRILLFLDDDDIADTDLLERHLESHNDYEQDHIAVLGLTNLAPDIAQDPLMHFVTEVGRYLFAYPRIKKDQMLDFTYFWGGRTSCKRAFLLHHGTFNPLFRFGAEDIELGYRLSEQGLKVLYNDDAVSVMIRAFDVEGFSRRCEAQGKSNAQFARLHNTPLIRLWTETEGVAELWQRIGPYYDGLIERAVSLDAKARSQLKDGRTPSRSELKDLHEAYHGAFLASRIKGSANVPIDSDR